MLSRRELFVTHIQVDELRATRKPPGRLESLLKVLQDIDPEKVATSAAVWNVSKWGEAQYGDSNGLCQPMLAALDTRNGAKANNSKEALIGVTAIARGLVLVTNDRRQGEAGRELGGEAISFDDFLHLRQSGATR